MRDNSSVDATVLLPTTGERGGLIKYALKSVLDQVGAQIEVFVVGDGAGESTRSVVWDLMERDRRIRFFDFPKGERRGEIYRHDLLTSEARGRVITYICDRDLWCHDHARSLCDVLEEVDFAQTVSFRVEKDQTLRIGPPLLDPGKKNHRSALLQPGIPARSGIPAFMPLSSIGHTLDAYRDLEEGWATTPPDELTDVYMWRKFLRRPDYNAQLVARPTVLWFLTGVWKTPDNREPGLAHWSARISETDWCSERWKIAFRSSLHSRTNEAFAKLQQKVSLSTPHPNK